FPQMSLSNLFTNAVIRAQHLHQMHKVETYLKVMKCRRFVESNCTF
uniref:Somatotropin (Fragments) n=1 Tax=Aquarana catesbeiana TaxID=8400 RepID=Q7LZC9_AQUCT